MKMFKKIFYTGLLLIGLSNTAVVAGTCDRGSKVITGGTLGHIINDAVNNGITSKYYLKPGYDIVRDIMSLSIANLGRHRVRNSCVGVKFIYGFGQAPYTSGHIRKMKSNNRAIGRCVNNAKKVGMEILVEDIYPAKGGFPMQSPQRDVEVFYLYDRKRNTSYPFWVGGKGIYVSRGRYKLMRETASSKCDLALDEAVSHRNALLHRDILRDAPKYRVDKRRNQRRFNGRPPVAVPPMLPPVLVY